ncbi:MAG: twin-arginine translocation signal domain-containing protein [Phycisphaerae bacterium]|nr:twin-arginine translocation signal domain-containing protein [Phycisphaerae bacterium]
MNPSPSRRTFVKRCGAAACSAAAIGSGAARGQQTYAETGAKHLSSLRATVERHHVRLRAYKTTPAFQDPDYAKYFRAIRVYRIEEPSFKFGRDYAEYFDGLSHKDAKLIFEGPIEPANNRKFTYIDKTARVDMTYAYWMAAAVASPTGPVPVKVRKDHIWWPEEKIRSTIATLKARHPDLVTIETLGRTICGREIQGLRVGKGKRCVGLVGAVHAGESGPELILPALENLLARLPELFDRASVAAVPVLNLDERQRLVEGVPWYLRTNANGVDLNRNFPADWDTVEYGYGLDTSDPDSATYRGRSPASEPETQAVMAFLRAQRVSAVYAFHCLASICGACFLAPKAAAKDKDYAARCRRFAVPYALGIERKIPEDQVVRYGASAGSLPHWCYRELGVPGYDLEISSMEKQALAKCREDRTDWNLLNDYQCRHSWGLRRVLSALGGGKI